MKPSSDPPFRRLDSSARASLVENVRKVSRPPLAGQRADDPLGPQPVARPFADLDGFESIRIPRALAARLGLQSPFYRVHDTRAGARTRIDDRDLVNFSSYDYLALNGHPEITLAVTEATARWGTSVSASRLTSGERPFHRQLEGELASLYGAQDALAFVSGHATNLALFTSLLDYHDLVVHDILAHNSIVEGARMSGAHRRSFLHNDLDDLDRLLTTYRRQYRNCLIATEGLFSMDGDGPDLARLAELKQKHGTWLMIDEAHSLGVLGNSGKGAAEHAGVDPSLVDVWMGTLSKTLVSCGGYVAGNSDLIEYLKYRAPGMVYSVGLPPSQAVAASTALDIMLREPERVSTLQANGRQLRDGLIDAGHDTGTCWGTGIVPLLVGDSLQTVLLADWLEREAGLAAVPIIPPGVPERSARLRFFLSAQHDAKDISLAVSAVGRAVDAVAANGLSLAGLGSELLRSTKMDGDADQK